MPAQPVVAGRPWINIEFSVTRNDAIAIYNSDSRPVRDVTVRAISAPWSTDLHVLHFQVLLRGVDAPHVFILEGGWNRFHAPMYFMGVLIDHNFVIAMAFQRLAVFAPAVHRTTLEHGADLIDLKDVV